MPTSAANMIPAAIVRRNLLPILTLRPRPEAPPNSKRRRPYGCRCHHTIRLVRAATAERGQKIARPKKHGPKGPWLQRPPRWILRQFFHRSRPGIDHDLAARSAAFDELPSSGFGKRLALHLSCESRREHDVSQVAPRLNGERIFDRRLPFGET